MANIVRLVLTSAILIVFVVVVGKLGAFADLPYTVVVLAAVSGIIGLGVGDTLYMLTLKIVGVARAVPITCTYPLFTLLFASALTGEPPTPVVSIGAVLIVAGIWLVSIERSPNPNVSRKLVLLGVVIGIATAMLWAVSITMMNFAVKYNHQLDSALAINTIRVTAIGAIFAASTPILYLREGLRLSRKTVLFLIVGGLVALGLGWFFLSYSLAVTDESRAVPLSSVSPLFSTLTAVLLFHEKIGLENVLGSVMIVIGIFVIFLL